MSKKRLNAQHEIARWEAERSLVEMELAYFRKQSADTEARALILPTGSTRFTNVNYDATAQ